MLLRDGDNLLDPPKQLLLEYKTQIPLEQYLELMILKMQFMVVIQDLHGREKLIISSHHKSDTLHSSQVALLASLSHMQLLMEMLVKL